jgi:drug/metabolite transporter (DMT)-like permease
VLPLALVGAILAVSTAAILIRLAQSIATSLSIAALRLTFASLILAPFALTRRRQQLRAIPRGDFLLASLAGLFLAVHFGTWITSLEYTTVASSVVLVSTGPLWVALLSPLFLGERISRAAFFGLLLALLGGLVIGAAGACTWDNGVSCRPLSDILRGRALWGNFLALVGALALSGYLIIGRRLRQTIDLVPYVFLVYSCAAVCLLIALFASGGTPFGLPTMAYVWVLLLALVPQLIGHSTYNWALGFLPAALVAVATLGEPIGSAIIAYFILKETPGSQVLLGGALVLSGIYIVSRAANKTTVPGSNV